MNKNRTDVNMKYETLRSPIFWGSTASGALIAIAVLLSSPKNIQDFAYSTSLILIFIVLGYIWDKINSRIKKVEKRVNIWIHEDRQERQRWRELAEQLEEIVYVLNSIRDPIEGKIALNGAIEVLKYKGLSYDELTNMIHILRKCTKFRGMAIYGPGEWMDPLWFAYLIAQVALLQRKGTDAVKRFFIYKKDIVASPAWNERLRAIVEAMGQSIPTYLCTVEKTEEELKNHPDLKSFFEKLYSEYNNGQRWKEPSFIRLMDIIYIEFGKNKVCKWRNPGKEGEPEDLKPEEINQLSVSMEPIYKQLENIAKIKQEPRKF